MRLGSRVALSARAHVTALALGQSVTLTAVSFRGFKKVKLTPEAIQAAVDAKAQQKKGYLDTYYGKYMAENKDRTKIDERENKEGAIQRDVTTARKKLFRIRNKGDDVAFEPFQRALVRNMRDSTAHANDPALSERARRKAYELHCAEPSTPVFPTPTSPCLPHSPPTDYWTALRLAALFKCNPVRMRSSLYASKLEAEAVAKGEVLDDVIEDGLVRPLYQFSMDILIYIFFHFYVWNCSSSSLSLSSDLLRRKSTVKSTFPMVSMASPRLRSLSKRFTTLGAPLTSQQPRPHISSRYYINPGIKSGELLKFVRSKETVTYRESSRIPAQPVPASHTFTEVRASGISPPKKFPVGKRPKWILYDSSESKTMYNRTIIVRDADGNWRTGNWEVRFPHIFHAQIPISLSLPSSFQGAAPSP